MYILFFIPVLFPVFETGNRDFFSGFIPVLTDKFHFDPEIPFNRLSLV